MRFNSLLGVSLCFIMALACRTLLAGNWPMYRADAARRGYSADRLPASLELRWVYRGLPPQPTWPSSARITYDFAHQPILAGGNVVFGSTVDDSVTALSAADGRERWKFLTGGPVRFAPAAWRDRVFVACDDGYLYALSLANGALLWKHHGGPSDRMCLGNDRMISRWPARGGPVVLDDTVYYAAGIWPSGGVYVHALDAATGRIVWSNDRTGQLRMPQPHGGAEALSGVTPQGYLVATNERLFVPTGRAVPAAFRRESGELDYYLLQENGSMGGARALISDRFVINGGCLLQRETGKLAARAGRGVFSVTPDGVLQYTGSKLVINRWENVDTHDRKGNAVTYRGLVKRAEVELADPPDKVRRAARVIADLPGLNPLFRTDIVFKDVDASVARQTGLERALAQSRPDVERLGADVGPFQATAYERTCEVICGRYGSRLRDAEPGVCCGFEGAGRSLVTRSRWRRDRVGHGRRNRCWYRRPKGCCTASPNRDLQSRLARPPAEPTISTIRGDTNAAIAAEELLRTSGVREGICLDVGCGEGRLTLELVRRFEVVRDRLGGRRSASGSRPDGCLPKPAFTAVERPSTTRR